MTTAPEWPPPGPVSLTAAGGTDLFSMPGIREIDDVPTLGRAVHGDFTFSAEVRVDGHHFADAGGLLARAGDFWLKVCVERTTDQGWTALSVVSRPDSDEAYGPRLDGPRAGLLVTRQGPRIALFLRSPEGAWRFLRTCRGPGEPMQVGFFAQAPFSPGATCVFSAARFSREPVRDRR